jgi:hypothetical protein
LERLEALVKKLIKLERAVLVLQCKAKKLIFKLERKISEMIQRRKLRFKRLKLLQKVE